MKIGRLLLSIIAFGTAVVPAYGQKPSLGMLDQLEPGSWDLRERGSSGTVQSLCLESGRQLIQLRHPGLACSSVVIQDDAQEITVQYTCRGHGYGRTHVRREASGLVQIDSQGIANGLPFSFATEGRRTGSCQG